MESAVSSSTAATTAPEPPAVARARTWLGRVVRTRVSDGRVFVGRLWCLDAHANLVLVDAEEFVTPDGEWRVAGRRRGLRRAVARSRTTALPRARVPAHLHTPSHCARAPAAEAARESATEAMKRYMGQVLVPKRHIVAFEVATSDGPS